MKSLRFVIIFLAVVNTVLILNAEENVKKQFEAKYQAWKGYISRPEIMVQSIAGPRFECPQFQEIVKLGLPALPYIVRKMEENPDEQFLWKAIEEITKVKIRGKYDKQKNTIIFPDFPDLKPGENVYLYWWREGRKQTPQLFGKLYSEWKELQIAGKEKEANEKYRKIKNLGIVALPYIMEKIKQGETELIPIVSYLTDESIKKDAKVSKCLDWWNRNKDKWIIPNGSE
ncbi:MAG: hypothetical protein COZ37_02220 [bacterium (Candidatus Ratteibacteria) CG_4_10_14_3_um_filter_41_18]|nr:MAG: hypothetical protein COZ37_02220 [bacterium (Candidatus Ratteibacteria) CG_4_10_14_3_um_filter_41_18]